MNNRTGTTHTEDAKAKIAKTLTGRKHSEESKKKIRESIARQDKTKRKSVGIETREKLSKRMLGNKLTLGMKHTEETKIKIGLGRLGKKLTVTACIKMSEAALALGQEHHTAAIYKFKAPDGRILEGKNILLFIRENKSMFSDADLEVRTTKKGQTYIRASTGLNGLRNNKRMKSWKGWTLA